MYKKVPSGSMDITQENINVMKQLFPEALTDGGKIDFDKLKLLLGEEIHRGREKYEFTWPGKIDTIRGAQLPTKATLKLDEKSSKNIESTENLYIEGDNLEVLKILQKSYYNKVKMIYIDPPYNTKQDFIYSDNYKKPLEEYLQVTKQANEEGVKLRTDVEKEGGRHTNWLNMMYSRLKLAKYLIKEDGLIFISIDDNEHHNLRAMMGEIFGEKNFVGTITWEKRTKAQNTKDSRDMFQSKTEYILIYQKNLGKVRFNLTIKSKIDYPHKDHVGEYRIHNIEQMSAIGMRGRETMIYPILGVFPDEEKQWKLGRETIEYYRERGDLHLNEGRPSLRIRPSDEDAYTYYPYWSHFFDKDSYGTAETGKKELDALLDTKSHGFETVKPLNLIKKLIYHTKIEKDDIILDFFSGSATTAHAVMKLNAEDGGNRKFIMVQLPEPTDEKSEAYKAGYSNICEIGKERIRRAGEQILEEHPEAADRLDVGFKVLKLDHSNIKEWNVTFDDLEEELDLFADTFVEGAREIDIVYEIMLKTGLELTLPIDSFEVEGKNVYDIAYGNLFVCLADGIDTTVAQAIVDKRKEYGIETSTVVFKDTGFGMNDSEKLNSFELLKDAGYQDDQLMTI